jgi:hypothetical protein
MRLTLAIALVSLSAACGGGASPAATPAEAEHHEHAAMSPALHDFHGVLAPVWHSGEGAARAEKACANAKALHEKAEPTADAELIADVAALETACAKEARPDVETRLAALHDRFHVLAEKH